MFFSDKKEALSSLLKLVKNKVSGKDFLILGMNNYAKKDLLSSDFPFYTIRVGKIFAPVHDHVAIGAVSEFGEVVLNENLITLLDIKTDYINLQIKEIMRSFGQNKECKTPIKYTFFDCGEFQKKSSNLNLGFLPSKSTKIYDEIDPLSTKRIAEGAILGRKEDQDRVKVVDFERIKPEVQVSVVIVDELMITGLSMLATVRSLRRLGVKNIIVAIPETSKIALDRVKQEVDDLLYMDMAYI